MEVEGVRRKLRNMVCLLTLSCIPITPASSLPNSVSTPVILTRFRLILLLLFCLCLPLLYFWFAEQHTTDLSGENTTQTGDIFISNTEKTLNAAGVGGQTCPVCRDCGSVATEQKMAEAAAAPSSSSSRTHATVETTQLFPPPSSASSSASSPSESTAHLLLIHGRGAQSRRGDQYHLCTFTNVCMTNDRLLLSTSNTTLAQQLTAQWKSQCFGPNRVEQWLLPPICSCFHPNFQPEFLTQEQREQVVSGGKNTAAGINTFRADFTHTWSIHKWVASHHIAHWAQKLIIWQALYQHADMFRINNQQLLLPPIDSLLFQDSDLPLSDHETVIFDAALAALQPERLHPIAMQTSMKAREDRIIWADALRQRLSTPNSKPACFSRVSFTPHYGIFSTHPDDTLRFRDAVYTHFGLPLQGRCPPKRAVLLYRHNRQILNRVEVQEMVKKEFGIDLEYLTIDETSTSEQQVTLFASTGLMLSSHSSQLINVLFSPAGSSMIEIAPEFYNADFSEYATGMGVMFQYALGGNVPEGVPQPLQQECLEKYLAPCEGASYCIIEKRYSCKNVEYPNKNKNFNANLTAVKMAVRNSLTHLNWLCGGRW